MSRDIQSIHQFHASADYGDGVTNSMLFTRALLREPDLIEKMQSGAQQEGICIHCNRCMPTIYSGTRCVIIDPDPIVPGPAISL